MGLAAKSSTEGSFSDEPGLTFTFSELLLQLAFALTQLAQTRLTKKQLQLLFRARQTLRYHPQLSPTGLADFLARKNRMPLSTIKFNLRILKRAGLLEATRTQKLRTTARLSFAGQLLTQLLPCPDMELENNET